MGTLDCAGKSTEGSSRNATACPCLLVGTGGLVILLNASCGEVGGVAVGGTKVPEHLARAPVVRETSGFPIGAVRGYSVGHWETPGLNKACPLHLQAPNSANCQRPP